MRKFIYILRRKYKTQLYNIKENPCEPKMKESLSKKIDQELFLHFELGLRLLMKTNGFVLFKRIL